MKTVEQAAREYAETKTVSEAGYILNSRNAFKAGAEFAQQWMSIKEQLPDCSPYLAKDKQGKIELFYIGEESFIKAIDITHWRRIEVK